LHGFTIAGNDMKFYFADARIVGNTVVVSSPDVPKPVSVRYGWADFPKVNLFNKKGLPASPFRTDDWPLPTNNMKVPYFNNKN
ncbi:MAG: 9-O-acetylesterase, partial [Bacteroidota bacterium]|nr:9-O-acetylesterase [Bacteroidota bacterium]